MTKRCIALTISASLAASAWAVYAPIPEEQLGKALTVQLSGGVYHDSNIFGGASNEVSSVVYRMAPSLEFASSLTDQTFFSAGYSLTYDYVKDRPQNQDLFNHDLHARVAHAFSQRATLDISNTFLVAENPESLLAGVPLNTDQSFRNNQFNVIFRGGLTERIGYTLKARSSVFDFDLPNLSTLLDRSETLLGVALDYAVSEATQALGEFRYLAVDYARNGSRKDKRSVYLLGGVDYAPSKQLSISARAGLEQRYRWGAPDDEAPYAEITGR